MPKLSPFDFIKSINTSKIDIMVDEEDEKDYPAFMVVRGLGWFSDTIFHANEMNINHHIDSKMQYSFLLNSIRRGRRFSKWPKADSISNLEAVKEYYGYSNEKARQALTLLTNEQIEKLKDKVSHGGRGK
tara:strand:+ start:289 stop:678 length:390 start_codon:yes stop_codon:yes gene_type:complete